MAGGRVLVGKLLGSHPVGRQEENGRMALRGLVGTHTMGVQGSWNWVDILPIGGL
jgi:hypothetical protein